MTGALFFVFVIATLARVIIVWTELSFLARLFSVRGESVETFNASLGRLFSDQLFRQRFTALRLAAILCKSRYSMKNDAKPTLNGRFRKKP